MIIIALLIIINTIILSLYEPVYLLQELLLLTTGFLV